MDSLTTFILQSAMRKAADEVVNLWWAHPYSSAKTDVVQAVILKHLDAAIERSADYQPEGRS